MSCTVHGKKISPPPIFSPPSLFLPTSPEVRCSLSLPFPQVTAAAHQATARPAGRATAQVRPDNPLPLLHPPCCLVVAASGRDASAPPVGETLAIMPDEPNPKLGHPATARGQSAAAADTVAPPVRAAAGFPLLPLSTWRPWPWASWTLASCSPARLRCSLSLSFAPPPVQLQIHG
jgi:hypothetical protein